VASVRRTAAKASWAAGAESAATTFIPAITYGWSSWAEGRKSRRYSETADSRACGAKCEAKAYGRPSVAASWAPNVEEPRTYSGTCEPRPGMASTPGTRVFPAR
jgi:hypothetical protein